MDIFINFTTRKLQRSATDSRPLQPSQLDFKRGDGAPLRIHFVQNNATVALEDGTVITFGAKADSKFDGTAAVLSSAFTKEVDGSVTRYVGAPSFNTTPLNTLLAVDEDDSNDKRSVDLMGEVTWKLGSEDPTSSETFAVRVQNDVLRGDETDPVDLEATVLELDSPPWLPAKSTITVDTNSSDSWEVSEGATSVGESSHSFANTTEKAGFIAAAITAEDDFSFTAYNVANVIHLVKKAWGSDANGESFVATGTGLTSGGAFAGGVAQEAVSLGQLAIVTLDEDDPMRIYPFRCVARNPEVWDGGGLLRNVTLGEWRRWKLSGLDGAESPSTTAL